MPTRYRPVAVNPVTGAVSFATGSDTGGYPVAVNPVTGVLTYPSGSSGSRPVAVNHQTGALTYFGGDLTPAQVSGLQYFLDGDSLAGLADAAAISSWADSGPETRHAVQATGAKQPTKQTVSGQAVARFAGDDTLLSPAFAVSLAQPFVTFVVCQLTLSGLADNAYIVGDQTIGDQGVVYGRDSDNTYAMYSGGSVGGVGGDGWTIIQAIFNGASSSIQANTATASGNAGAEALPRVCIGSNRDGGQYVTGDVAAVAMFKPIPSTLELAGLRAGFGAKYGIAVT